MLYDLTVVVIVMSLEAFNIMVNHEYRLHVFVDPFYAVLNGTHDKCRPCDARH
jgi:hypothetical protein